MFQGQRLADERKLADYNIVEGSTILAVEQVRGGGTNFPLKLIYGDKEKNLEEDFTKLVSQLVSDYCNMYKITNDSDYGLYLVNK